MRIAIATSGLGHVYRGMEGWAELLAEELHKLNINVTLFRGARPAKKKYDVCIHCIKRTSILSKILSKLNVIGGWRFGFGWPAQVETWSYGFFLLWHIRKKYDLIHVKQAQLALFLRLAQKIKILKTPFVLGNGQVATPDFLKKIKYVHFLSPIELNDMNEILGNKKQWFYVPNLINTEHFSPISKVKCRKKLKIPIDCTVILTVGAIQRYHKRMDYFIEEMNELKARTNKRIHIIITGSWTNDSYELINLAKKYFGANISVFSDIPKYRMPEIYNCADIFVISSLKEAFGNVLVEAMACEIPVIHHFEKMLRWVASKGGVSVDLTKKSALSNAVLYSINNSEMMKRKGIEGRKRVLEEFSTSIVIAKMLRMYTKIIRNK